MVPIIKKNISFGLEPYDLGRFEIGKNRDIGNDCFYVCIISILLVCVMLLFKDGLGRDPDMLSGSFNLVLILNTTPG
jgi:hypothetical protein